MSDSPDKENKGANGASNPPAAGKKPARIPLPFTILILLLVSGIVLFAILFALQFFYTRNLGNSLPSSVTGTQKESSSNTGANTGGDDGAPISILPEQPGGVTILEKQAESTGGESAAPSAPVAQGAGIATGFAMDLGAADSFIDLTRRFATIVAENGENNFLHFMPADVRTAMRDSWYIGSDAETKMSKTYAIVNENMPVRIPYQTANPKAEFISMVTSRLGALAGPPDILNRCARKPCYSEGATADQRRIEASLQTLSSQPAARTGMQFIDFMPDEVFLRVSTPNPDKDFAYTLIRNKDHTNVAFMFEESERRNRAKDTLTVYPGLLGSYPNFMFHVPVQKIEAFTAALHAAQSQEQFLAVVDEYGLARSNPAIWENFQWFVDYTRRTEPLAAGVYDLSRYKKIADLSSDEKR